MATITTSGTLSATVPDGGTFTVTYPGRPAPDSGSYDAGSFQNAMGHKLIINQATLTYPKQFDLTFGASITVTNRSGASWAAGASYWLDLDVLGKPIFYGTGKTVNRTSRADVALINLGAPAAAAANAVSLSQAVGAGANALLNGAAGGNLDTPRALVGAWTGASVVTVTGKDEYGNTIIEASPSGTTFTGKKAFRSISKITSSGAVTALTFGTGNVLGLPAFLPGIAFVLRELQDGAVAAAGTIVPGIRGAGGSTSTSGDVRGTYVPAVAPDGTKVYQLLAALPDPGYLGISQFAG